jgi:ribonuclease HI
MIMRQICEVKGAGGVLFDPRGSIELTYFWSLGQTTNNQAEAYALLEILKQLRGGVNQLFISLNNFIPFK